MSTITSTRPRVNAKSRPLTVEMVLTINGQTYDVEPMAHAPGALKSYRLAKRLGGDSAVYDLDAHADRIVCTCPSYTKTHEGTSSLCKHGRALVMVGLCDYPDSVTDPRDAYNDAREKLAALEVAEATVRAEAGQPAPVAPAFDAELYRCQNAVAERRALWLAHRHLHTSDPLPAPNPARDIVILDDDGTPLETSREMADRHRAEHEAKVAELMEGNPFLPACCPDAEPIPCRACVTHHGGPADLSDGSWDDDFVWSPSDFTPDDAPGPDRRTLAERIDAEARHYRTIGTDFGDLIAATLAKLADEVRYLGATTPAAYFDRREAALDAARDAAEARMAGR